MLIYQLMGIQPNQRQPRFLILIEGHVPHQVHHFQRFQVLGYVVSQSEYYHVHHVRHEQQRILDHSQQGQ